MKLGEANFDKMFDATDAAVVVCDPAGVIRYVNGNTGLLFGYHGNDLVGQLVETLVPESFRQVHEAHRAGFFAHPETRFMGSRLELSGRRRDGSQFPAQITLSSIHIEDGPLVIAAVYDMTDRNKAMYDTTDRNKADTLAAIVESCNDAIFSSTLDGVVTSWNPAAERLFGCPSQEVIGKSMMLLELGEGVEEIADILAQIRAGQPVRDYESVRVREDGTEVFISLIISPVKDADGAIIGASAIVRDLNRLRVTKHEVAH